MSGAKKYTIQVDASIEPFVKKLPKKDKLMLRRAIESLEIDPESQADGTLSGFGKIFYKKRCRHYRIIYEVRRTAVLVYVIAIGDRKNIYKILKRKHS